jgi:hypothetical protein
MKERKMDGLGKEVTFLPKRMESPTSPLLFERKKMKRRCSVFCGKAGKRKKKKK